jgi:hypothetical protein
MTTLNEVFAQVQALSFEDQRALNKMLVANLNCTTKLKSMQVAAKFNIGDEVLFDAKSKGIVKIKVTGFSRDGSSLKGTQLGGLRPGCNWTVGATICNKV